MAAPTIRPYNGVVPQRSLAPSEFANNADDWVAYQAPLAADYNALGDYVDDEAATIQGLADDAATSETNAATSASNASTSESNASTSETNAATSASNASTSETNAATSATNAANSFDSFDDRYLGAKTSDPTLDNDGDALITGALYFNSDTDNMRVWLGSAWANIADLTGSVDINGGTIDGTAIGETTKSTGKFTSLETDTVGAADGSALLPSLTNTGDTNTGVFFPADDTFAFATGGVERMRVNSNGVVVIGAETPYSDNAITLVGNGQVFISRDSVTVLDVNRTGSDGSLIQLKKAGALVGSISTLVGGLSIGSGASALRFGGTAVQPFNETTNLTANNVVDLGTAGSRFKDAYIAGGVFLGGTAEANKLDDYEEGTWTPTLSELSNLSGTPTALLFRYVKVGELVTISGEITGLTITTDNTDARLTSTLPFLSKDNKMTEVGSSYWATTPAALGYVLDRTVNNDTQISIGILPSVVSADDVQVIRFSLTYRSK